VITYETLSFLAQATQPQPEQPGIASMLIPFLCIGVIFYFLIIRPQKKKQKDQENLIKSLKTGDHVITAGGIHGMVANVKERSVIVKVADNVKIELEKTSVTTVTKSSSQEPAKLAAS
jgi:preprotein translocase subunit YajC